MTLAETLFIEYILRDILPYLFDEDMEENPDGDFIKKGDKYMKLAKDAPFHTVRYSIKTSKTLRIARKAVHDAERFEEAQTEARAAACTIGQGQPAFIEQEAIDNIKNLRSGSQGLVPAPNSEGDILCPIDSGAIASAKQAVPVIRNSDEPW